MAEEKTAPRSPRVGPRAATASTAPLTDTVENVAEGEREVVEGKPFVTLEEVVPQNSTISFLDLRGYIAYRRAQIYRPRLGGNIGGAPAIQAAQAESVLKELEALAEWMENGRPTPRANITEVDKDFYRAAVARGLAVPEEITRQL